MVPRHQRDRVVSFCSSCSYDSSTNYGGYGDYICQQPSGLHDCLAQPKAKNSLKSDSCLSSGMCASCSSKVKSGSCSSPPKCGSCSSTIKHSSPCLSRCCSCSPRISELAFPKPKAVQDTLDYHSHLLEADRVERLVRLMHQANQNKLMANRLAQQNRQKLLKQRNMEKRMKRIQENEKLIDNHIDRTADMILKYVKSKSKVEPNYKQMKVAMKMFAKTDIQSKDYIDQQTKTQVYEIIQHISVMFDAKCELHKKTSREEPKKSTDANEHVNKHIMFSMDTYQYHSDSEVFTLSKVVEETEKENILQINNCLEHEDRLGVESIEEDGVQSERLKALIKAAEPYMTLEELIERLTTKPNVRLDNDVEDSSVDRIRAEADVAITAAKVALDAARETTREHRRATVDAVSNGSFALAQLAQGDTGLEALTGHLNKSITALEAISPAIKEHTRMYIKALEAARVTAIQHQEASSEALEATQQALEEQKRVYSQIAAAEPSMSTTSLQITPINVIEKSKGNEKDVIDLYVATLDEARKATEKHEQLSAAALIAARRAKDQHNRAAFAALEMARDRLDEYKRQATISLIDSAHQATLDHERLSIAALNAARDASDKYTRVSLLAMKTALQFAVDDDEPMSVDELQLELLEEHIVVHELDEVVEIELKEVELVNEESEKSSLDDWMTVKSREIFAKGCEDNIETQVKAKEHELSEVDNLIAITGDLDVEVEPKLSQIATCFHEKGTASYVDWSLYSSWLNEFSESITTYCACLKSFHICVHTVGVLRYKETIQYVLQNWSSYLAEASVIDKKMLEYFKDKPITRCEHCRDYSIYDVVTNHCVPQELIDAAEMTKRWRKLLNEANCICENILNSKDCEESCEDSTETVQVLDMNTSSSKFSVDEHYLFWKI